VGKAVTNQGMTREEANKIVLKLLEKYEHVFSEPEKYVGKRFDQAYDMATVTPLPEWERMYLEVKDELKDMGLKL
jgi:methylamine--corrinoid protein Co-methyltransferase